MVRSLAKKNIILIFLFGKFLILQDLFFVGSAGSLLWTSIALIALVFFMIIMDILRQLNL